MRRPQTDVTIAAVANESTNFTTPTSTFSYAVIQELYPGSMGVAEVVAGGVVVLIGPPDRPVSRTRRISPCSARQPAPGSRSGCGRAGRKLL